jgi:HEPN domain-containing protein
MRPDPVDEGSRWLDQAKEDLTSAEVLLREERFYLVCFLAQQVAEKAFKAHLYARGASVVLGHSVEELGRRAASSDISLEEVRQRAAELDAYYVPTRYPNGLPASIPARVFGRESAVRALGLAREVVEAIDQCWPRGQAS